MCLFVPDSGPICIEIDVGEMFMNEYLDDVYFKFDKSMAKDHRPIQSNPIQTTLITTKPSSKSLP